MEWRRKEKRIKINQLQILRQMSGVERLNQALLLSDFTRELTIKNIKNQLGPKVTLKKLEEELRRRIFKS